MSNRFSLDGSGAAARTTTPTASARPAGGGVRVVSSGGSLTPREGGGGAAAASQDARVERATALGGASASSGGGGGDGRFGGGGGGGGGGGAYVPAHLRNGGRGRAGGGGGGGGYGGGRGGGYGGGRGGGYGDRGGGGRGYGGGGGRGGGPGDYGSFGGGDRRMGGGQQSGGFGGFGGQQQGGPMPQRGPMQGGQQQRAPPEWPGVDGGADFEDSLPADQEAFTREFGEPRSSGIDFAKYDKIDVEVVDSAPDKPKLPPKQKEFKGLGLGKVLSRNLRFNNYEVPTPVQQNAIPIAVSGRDVMACAQTGSGKTLAFMLPICWHLLKRGAPPAPQDRRVPISALTMAPTRELAIQIHEESKKFAFRSGLRFAIAYGGTHVNEQIRAIERGCDVLIATPGRLVDMMERGVVTLRHIIFLVLDEADRMLDMGFEPQMRQIIMGADMPQGAEGRRTMMFSATFPTSIQRLAADFLYEPVNITVGKVGGAASTVTQVVMNVEDDMKPKVLCDLLTGNPGRTLIFVETKRNADMLEFALQVRQNQTPTCAQISSMTHTDPILFNRMLRKTLMCGSSCSGPEVPSDVYPRRSEPTGARVSAQRFQNRCVLSLSD